MSSWSESLVPVDGGRARESMNSSGRMQAPMLKVPSSEHDHRPFEAAQSEPGSNDAGHSIEIDTVTPSSVMAYNRDHALRAFHGLEYLAKRLTMLRHSEGEVVGEITTILKCRRSVWRSGSDTHHAVNEEYLEEIHRLGESYDTFLAEYCAHGSDPSYGERIHLTVSTAEVSLGIVAYSRQWHEENRFTRKLDQVTEIMLARLCKILSTTNIILFVSYKETPRFPPWESDEILSKRFEDDKIDGFPGNYRSGLSQTSGRSDPQVARNLVDVQDASGKECAVATNQGQSLGSIQLSANQDDFGIFWPTRRTFDTPARPRSETYEHWSGKLPRQVTSGQEDDLPLEYRRLTEHLQTGSNDFNKRLAAYLTNQVAMRSAMEQMTNSLYNDQLHDMGLFATTMSSPPVKSTSQLGSHVDAMDIDRNVGDNSMASLQHAEPFSEFQPPVFSNNRSGHEILQSRPLSLIEKIVPAEGPMAGGTEVSILGNGFYKGLEVMFGGKKSIATTFWGDRCLGCVVPPTLTSGTINVWLKSENQNSQMQQLSQSQASTFKYIDATEVGPYRDSLVSPGNDTQSLKDGSQSMSREPKSSASDQTSTKSAVGESSQIVSNNFAMMVYLAGCLETPATQPAETDQILEEVGRILMSLRSALATSPLEDHTILSAVLLWCIENAWNHQDKAELHWNGIQVLLQCRPDFDIARPLTRFAIEASLVLTDQEHNTAMVAGRHIAETFRSAVQNTRATDHADQDVTKTAAPTPAATVYSPWSETDVDPPPYMLSPTPLRQACLIYAAVNARKYDDSQNVASPSAPTPAATVCSPWSERDGLPPPYALSPGVFEHTSRMGMLSPGKLRGV